MFYKKIRSIKKTFAEINIRIVFIIALVLTINILLKFEIPKPQVNKAKNFINQTEPNRNQPTVFCLIFTTWKTVSTKGKTVFETWGKKCDKTKLVLKFPKKIRKSLLKMTDLDYNENSFIDSNNLLEPANFKSEPASSYGLTEKVHLALMHIYSKYPNYDWYLKADDDTFIFVDNLRKFLIDKDPRNPVTYGYNFLKFIPEGYHSGGAGYVMSNEALIRLGRKLHEDRTFCPSQGVEDVEINTCLRNLGVHLGDSIDDFGRERFHPLSLDHHFDGSFPDWLNDYAKHKPKAV